MNNKLKLSSFLGGHSIRYVNGVKEVQNEIINGEVKLLKLSEIKNGTVEINNIIQRIVKIDKNDKDFINKLIEIQYDVIKLITNVEVNITREEFVQSVNNEDPKMVDFVQDVQSYFNHLKDTILKIVKQLNSDEDLKKEVISQKSELQIVKEDFEQISKAYNNEKDTKLKHDYFVNMCSLMAKIEKLEKESNTEEDKVVDVDFKENKVE